MTSKKGKQSPIKQDAAAALWGMLGAWAWEKFIKSWLDHIPFWWKVIGGLLLSGILAIVFRAPELAWPIFIATAALIVYRIVGAGKSEPTTKPERVVKDWTATVADIPALRGSTAKLVNHDKYGFTVQVGLAGKTVTEVTKATDTLESVFKTKVGALQVVADPERAHVALLRFTTQDPLEAPVPWPGPDAHHLAEPVALGVDRNGQTVRVELLGQHVLVAGQTGSGKSTVLGVLVRSLIAMEDVMLWGVDAKPGAVELGQYEDHLARLASEPDEVLVLLRDAKAEIVARGKAMRENHLGTTYPISPERPALVVVVDELAELTDAAKGELEGLARVGRGMRVSVIIATQRPSVEQLGSGSLRSSMGATIGLKVRTSAESRLVFGDEKVAAGWDSSRLTGGKGRFLLLDEQHQLPVPARCFWAGNRPVLRVVGDVEQTA